MKIVIDIDDEDYRRIQDISDVFDSLGISITSRTYSAIIKGAPLPKHHGRLKDIDAFITKVKADRKHSAYLRSWTADDVLNALDNSYAPTLIERSDTDECNV